MFASTTWDKMTDADQQSIVKSALERPREFGYHGDNEEMFQTWTVGPTILSRDSSLLEKANAKALVRELEAKPEFEDEWEIVGCSHWAVGWVDHLSFRVKDGEDKPTAILAWLNDWYAALNDYPVADDDLHSEMQWKRQMKQLRDDGAGEHVDEVVRWLDENNYQALESVEDDYLAATEDDIQEAMIALGHIEPTSKPLKP
jgi:hypothetical protein